MKILDSDIYIKILRGNGKVIDKRRAVTDNVATTWITAPELVYGAENPGRLSRTPRW